MQPSVISVQDLGLDNFLQCILVETAVVEYTRVSPADWT